MGGNNSPPLAFKPAAAASRAAHGRRPPGLFLPLSPCSAPTLAAWRRTDCTAGCRDPAAPMYGKTRISVRTYNVQVSIIPQSLSSIFNTCRPLIEMCIPVCVPLRWPCSSPRCSLFRALPSLPPPLPLPPALSPLLLPPPSEAGRPHCARDSRHA